MLSDVSEKPSENKHHWWHFCVILAFYLVIPFRLILAKSMAKVM